MTDPTTTPTPTNEQQGARAFDQAPYLARALNWASIDALANTPDYVLAEKLAGCPHLDAMFRAYLAAVSAAAPDEREVLRAAIYKAIAQAVIDPELGINVLVDAATDAALAARPAPVVSGERGALTLADAWDEGWRACAGAAGSASPHHNGPANPYRTVADAPAADDEGGQER